MIRDIKDWGIFVKDLSTNILPIYKNHESTFDYQGIHGRMHISRALIFAESMARYYYKVIRIKDIDFLAIRYAVAFHDAGRKGNGIDIWESDSAEICRKHLLNQGHGDEYSKYVSQLIEKKGPWDAHKKIVHDADVLEIMRPCCGHGGRSGFKEKALRFLSYRDDLINNNLNDFASPRNTLIDEAWQFIVYTERKKYMFNKSDFNYFYDLVMIIDEINNNLSMIKGLLME